MTRHHDPLCVPDPETGHCAICSDEGLEGRIIALRDGSLADVEIAGRTREVAVELIDHPRIGDTLLVHAGVAIARTAVAGTPVSRRPRTAPRAIGGPELGTRPGSMRPARESDR